MKVIEKCSETELRVVASRTRKPVFVEASETQFDDTRLLVPSLGEKLNGPQFFQECNSVVTARNIQGDTGWQAQSTKRC